MNKELAVQEPSVPAMLQAVIAGGITSESVDALGKLCDLHERMQAKQAQQAFASSFVALQADMPAIAATKPVPNKDGSIRYKFAPYEEIMRQTAPLLARHGFTVSFNSRFLEGRITVICTLMHRDGFSRDNEFAVRIGGGPPGATETQADGAAKTYAKRGALCDCLNITVEHDDDAAALGSPITQEQADSLRKRVELTKADVQKFLHFAGADSFETITSAKMGQLDEFLTKKEKKIKQEAKDVDGN